MLIHFHKLFLVSILGLLAGAQVMAKSSDEHHKSELATFAGGCFWCMEPAFDEVNGVLETIVGYAGGEVENPTYSEVTKGQTGHAEVIQVRYDPKLVNYETLLAVFWRNIDPSVPNRQFCDVGTQYRSAIFAHDQQQTQLATASLQALKDSKRFEQVYTQIEPLTHFYPAEEYHQDYYRKNPLRYKFYRYGCGRDKRLNAIWGEDQAGD